MRCKKYYQYIWLDIININQNARNITAELEIVPIVYTTANNHAFISRSDLIRGWCYFEYLLRTSVFSNNLYTFFIERKSELRQDFYFLEELAIHSLNEHILQETFRYSRTKFTVENDRKFVENEIIKRFGSLEKAEDFAMRAFINSDTGEYYGTNQFKQKPSEENIESLLAVAKKHDINVTRELINSFVEKEMARPESERKVLLAENRFKL